MLQHLFRDSDLTVQHPPYSPDFAPFDYHVLAPLKHPLQGQRFGNDDKVKEVLHSWLKAHPFFSKLTKLVQWCEMCIVG